MHVETQIPSRLLLTPSPTFFSLSLSSYERYNSLGWGSIGLSGGIGGLLAFYTLLASYSLAISTDLHLEYVDDILGSSNALLHRPTKKGSVASRLPLCR